MSRGMIASTLRRLHRYEEAVAEHRQTVAAMERVLGPRHPRLAALLNNLAITLSKLQELAEAKRDMSEMREQLAELRQSNKELKAEVEAARRVP